MEIQDSDGESTTSDQNDLLLYKEECYYTKPDIVVPNFLNTDYKWNKCVMETETLQQYCQLIGQITNADLEYEEKCNIMFHLTTDITMYHRQLIPHWKLLQYHSYFNDIDIL